MDSEIETLIRDIVDRGHLMSLATVDQAGPWVADVIYVHDADLNLYWLSHTTTRHSQALAIDHRVAATITITTGPKQDNIGLQIEGDAYKMDGDRLDLAGAHLRKRGKSDQVVEGEIIKPDHAWYRLEPRKIELIYEPKFGFEKRSLVVPAKTNQSLTDPQ